MLSTGSLRPPFIYLVCFSNASLRFSLSDEEQKHETEEDIQSECRRKQIRYMGQTQLTAKHIVAYLILNLQVGFNIIVILVE